MKTTFVKCLCLTLFAAGSLLAGEPAGQKLRQELSHSPDRCMEVFQDGKADPALRRTAFRFLLESPRAEEVLNSGMKDTDSVIRCRAIYELFQRQGVNSYEFLKAAAVSETNPQAALILLGCAKNFPDKEKSRELLTELAQKSKVRDVRRSANRIVDFPFFREVRLLRNDPTHDHEVVTVMSVPLPQEGWRFHTDPMENGHHKGWFESDFNDSKWKQLKVGVWETQGYHGYDGIAWYRIRFTMPPKSECAAVELHFGAVDEAAWVWLNGKFVGQHDIGTSGWDRPFDLNITDEINWDGENVLVVRVEDTAAAGGIWKPIVVNLVK